MNWRVIPLSSNNAFMNMAIDEAVCEAVASGKFPPTIRFYTWLPSAVSIGYFQSLNDEVDVNVAKELGVDIVRRRTGGGAVYHDSKGEITYSVVAPESVMPKGIRESYQLVCGWITGSLKNLGIVSEFRPINDIIAGDKKISGNAQTRRNGVLLQHGTLLYDLDVRTMFTLLKVPKEKISDKMIQSVEERVTKVLNFGSFSMQDVSDAMMKGFTRDKEYEIGSLTDEEINRAKELAENRYKTDEWNYRR
ncbi:MAG: lipoate--protein ligase family protein [Candidatus Aenigmarchaeota archaeon]|nr:lipoate--protein ligase family protein [Candidatus Aenigmarchaeota archaeon]